METPKTIHDFSGFPQELYEVQYPAKGSPILAQEMKDIVQPIQVELDQKWGLDHGALDCNKTFIP
jgi:4,5-DOPA dioxygenase extradiol